MLFNIPVLVYMTTALFLMLYFRHVSIEFVQPDQVGRFPWGLFIALTVMTCSLGGALVATYVLGTLLSDTNILKVDYFYNVVLFIFVSAITSAVMYYTSRVIKQLQLFGRFATLKSSMFTNKLRNVMYIGGGSTVLCLVAQVVFIFSYTRPWLWFASCWVARVYEVVVSFVLLLTFSRSVFSYAPPLAVGSSGRVVLISEPPTVSRSSR